MNATKISKWLIYALLIITFFAIMWSFGNTSSSSPEISVSELAQAIRNNEISEITVSSNGQEVSITYKDANKQPTSANISDVSSLEEVLNNYGISEVDYADGEPTITYERPSPWVGYINLIGIFLPALLILGFIYFMFRSAQGSNNQAMSFGKSKARLFTGDHPTVTFDDVAGCDEAK
ncbi:MAG: ATP-dependent metallopeptidase FtsH/Yme1/Tma family protein, partial [Anaerolineae bacterium]|nr:ATP-dependent metallopeptidase FtsH/Yme1/Tma family protein [Anaerolineae bacterium]